MKKEKLVMLAVIIASILCTYWAITIPAYAIAVGLVLNALFCTWVLLSKTDSRKEK